MMKRLAGQRLVVLGLCIAGGAGLAYLVIANLLDDGVSNMDRAVALVIGLAALLVLWRLEFPSGLSRDDLRQPVGRAQVMNVGLGLFGVLATVVGMMSPAAVESHPGVIESLVRSIAGDVHEMKAQQEAIGKELGVGEPSLIRQRIAGRWGEDGCSVIRRFDLKDRALEISTVRVPPTMKPLHWTFTVETEANEVRPQGMRSSTITATEREGLFPGSSVKFRYLTDGIAERLVWDSENEKQAAPELVRCA
jgi:hypothetical protein